MADAYVQRAVRRDARFPAVDPAASASAEQGGRQCRQRKNPRWPSTLDLHSRFLPFVDVSIFVDDVDWALRCS
ncbi:hypothetical protein [Cupriavidus necator]|uniref:hypothetical protein n=1 Tax=Cupriavidus necator TaxID=106590 RepID=UPI0012DA2E55|nr:hypothetical protein [Cupriavidus necator]QQB75986.1 hypothetical protein I6H87_14405 [Cupriavidus necator]WKA39571.1 hypothetical protein QWP09_11755 [Cupriavidus necator]